jgi:hypothetical protein
MLVVEVVDVGMLMIEFVVGVLVLVPLPQQKRDAERHERHRSRGPSSD